MSVETQVDVADEIPTPEEYCAMRKACGLSEMTLEAAREGLPRSLYSISLRAAGKLVGMGRVVGDGLHVQIVDIAVHPTYQKQGLSRVILEKIVAFVDSEVPRCAVISLFADVDWLYQKFGFRAPEKSLGMFYKKRSS